MISCAELLRALGDLLDADVSAEEGAVLRHHLATCRTCTAIYDSTRRTVRILTESRSFELSPELSERLRGRVIARIASEQS